MKNKWLKVFALVAVIDIMAVCIDLLYGAEIFTAGNALRLLVLLILGIAAICELGIRRRRRQESQNP